MPSQVTITESYWSVCWKWKIPYPCKKYRTVTKWCYNFRWIKEYRWGFFCYLEGCENGVLYDWYAFCLNIFGSQTFYNIEKCFGKERDVKGECSN